MPKGIYKRTKPAWNKGHKTWHSFICQTCKKNFFSQRTKAKFCKRSCIKTSTQFEKGHIPIYPILKGSIPWNKDKREFIKKTCPTCKNEFSFILTGRGSKPREQKFCSRKCIRNKTQFQKGFIPWIKGKKFNQTTREKIKKARLKQVFPTHNTKLEIKVHDLLKEKQIKFETYYPILGQPDIFIEPNILIFCDGCYWHKCPKCGFGNQRKRDLEITKELQKQGYKVIRLWEHEVNNQLWRKKFVQNVMVQVKSKVDL